MAMITNKNTHDATTWNYEVFRNTKNTVKTKSYVDVNLDKEYNENDGKLVYDFNFALLTSKDTFSSANMLAVRAKENGVMIIGQTSGGGSCCVTKLYTPGCELIRSSMYRKSIFEKGGDVDIGAEVDVDLRKPYTGEFDAARYGTDDPAEMSFYDYSDFYDYENLEKLIDEFYDKGDINGDGFKNNKDVIALFRYVSSIDPQYAAKYDINSNGKINNKDVVALFRKVSET
jgi:hypothetical protein